MTDKYAGHTPGPWGAGREIGYGQLNGIQIKDGRGYVAAVVVADVPELYESREANARLIADAPSLLKRVIELEGLLQKHGQHEPFCRTYQERVGGNCICELAALNSDAPPSKEPIP